MHDILRQLARRPFPTVASRRGGTGQTHRANHELGGICPSRLRRDPPSGGGLASGDASVESGSQRSQVDRTSGASRDHRPPARPAVDYHGGVLRDERDVALALHEDREGIGAVASSIDGTALVLSRSERPSPGSEGDFALEVSFPTSTNVEVGSEHALSGFPSRKTCYLPRPKKKPSSTSTTTMTMMIQRIRPTAKSTPSVAEHSRLLIGVSLSSLLMGLRNGHATAKEETLAPGD